MIDLSAAKPAIAALIESSLRSFAKQNPDTDWSSFAIYSCPWVGWAMTSFDTATSSDEIVARWEKNGPDWYGEDAWGRFNDNCPDFEFHDWLRIDFPEWGAEYEAGEPIHVRDLAGADHHIDSANESLNGLVFSFLCDCLTESLKSGALPIASPDSSPGRRFGVQMLDSEYVEFWHESQIGQQSG